MDSLLLHSTTQKQLEQFTRRPPQAIALIGPAGSGKGVTARELAASILGTSSKKLSAYPYFKVYTPENSNISIEKAREITKFTKLRTSGPNTIRRVIVVEDAQTMTLEAQNALLKTLEEPPTDTILILTLTNTSAILPTILSRLQIVPIHTVSQEEAVGYFTNQGQEKGLVTQYYLMSGGRAGLMQALLSNTEDHPFTLSIQQAKEVLQKDHFARLLMVDDIVKQKQTEGLISAINVIARSALYTEASRTNAKTATLKRWGIVLEKSEEAKQLLTQNAQAKLVLTSLFLEI